MCSKALQSDDMLLCDIEISGKTENYRLKSVCNFKVTRFFLTLPCKQHNWTSGTYSIEIILDRNHKGVSLNSLKISQMSLTILSYMHFLRRRADLVKKKNTFLGMIILVFFACALRHCRVMTCYYATLKYQAKPRTIA